MPIRVVPYDPSWPDQFAAIRVALADALRAVPFLAIEHVGSTSVPGLAAKPVIDVDVVVLREHLTPAIEALVAAGYQHEGDLGIRDRHAMRAADSVRRSGTSTWPSTAPSRSGTTWPCATCSARMPLSEMRTGS